ncbi:MAG: heavy metal translocating P-type ATPase [Candidatus Nitrosocosmicus sp.]
MSGACEYIPQGYARESRNTLKAADKRLDIIRLALVFSITILVAWLNLLPFQWLSDILVIGTVLIGGFPIFKESFLALRKGRVNMELSMVVAILASIILIQLLPAIVITFFALMSEFLEELIVQKGRKNIEMLYSRAPKKALVIVNKDVVPLDSDPVSFTDIKEIPINDIKLGDLVLVREGDIIPVDGSIVAGSSTIDQSTITGESTPMEKKVDDFVYTGTINLDNKLEVICEKISTETAYAKIIHLVEESESKKAPIQKLSDKMATRLIQFAIGLAILTYIVTQDLMNTLSVIVVAGACGLAVGTPIALLASNSRLAKNGIIVKGGIQIENTGNAGTIVFDKTGTLTIGKPTVAKIISFNKLLDYKKILEYAAVAERDVNHPLAKAIVEKAISENIKLMEEDIEKNKGDYETMMTDSSQMRIKNQRIYRVGKGTSVFYNGHTISVGNIHFIKEQLLKFGKPSIAEQNLDYLRNGDMSSLTTVVVARDEEITGVIFLEDKLRKDAKEAIAKIKSMGLKTVMLTGDNEYTAEKIANAAGIEEYYSNLLPEDKVNKIKEIVKKNKDNKNNSTVIMVGDGINDAPALAESDIGIAMGKTGTDIVIETADVILMTDNLNRIPLLIKSSRGTIFTIKQNFFGTLFVDGFGFVLAFVGLLNPLLAAFIHVVSELVFMVNSARLIKNT